MDIRQRLPNLGALLAIATGIFLLALTTWQPTVRQSALGEIGSTWGLAMHGLGAAVLGAPFLVMLWPRTLVLAKGLLFVCGGLMIALGIAMLVLFQIGISALVDIVPGALAIAAGWLLQPRRRMDMERAVAARQVGRERRMAEEAAEASSPRSTGRAA